MLGSEEDEVPIGSKADNEKGTLKRRESHSNSMERSSHAFGGEIEAWKEAFVAPDCPLNGGESRWISIGR